VYVAVLGTALVASTLALAALALQRVQNRQLALDGDVRQAQLNAEAAIELGLLTIRNDDNWRTTYGDEDGAWFTRSTGNGSCSLEVTDPIDDNLEDSTDEPFVLLGIGTSGDAEQRVELYVDPRQQPADVLYTAADAGGSVANQSSALDWDAVIDTYQAAGTEVSYDGLPTASNLEFARNVSFDANGNYWEDQPPGLPDTDFTRATNTLGHAACLFIDRDDKRGGAGNELQVDRLKPNTTYQVTVEIHPNLAAFQVNMFKVFMITEYSDGTYVESAGSTTSLNWLTQNTWNTVSATITTPNWASEPANVYLVINSDHTAGLNRDFYIDNLHVYENVGGRLLYQQALGPSGANTNGIYWIDCGGGQLMIERTRILGTLVVLNAGAGSAISNGPVNFAPVTSGYPALLVDGDFAIRATNRALNEAASGETGTNFNPTGIAYEFNNALCSNTDTSANDVYPSEIQGLVAVSGNLTFANSPRIRGQVIAGGTITGAPSMEQRLDAVFNPPPEFTGTPTYERRPSSARKSVVP
jgi:hypothetical protein